MEKLFVAKRWSAIRQGILDTLFPIHCLGCETDGTFVCPTCFDRIPEPEYQVCPVCRAPYAQAGAVCRQCRRQTSLDGLLIAAPYRHRLVEVAVHTFKYRFIEALADPLARLIERSLSRNSLPLPDAVVPVPLHSRRLRYRGFNQARLLADALATDLTPGLALPVLEPICRTRFTKPQMKTSKKEERLQNLSGAFAVESRVAGPLVGKYIWLIDDVATTGTTLAECAKVLKQAGAKTVWGIVIAR